MKYKVERRYEVEVNIKSKANIIVIKTVKKAEAIELVFIYAKFYIKFCIIFITGTCWTSRTGSI